MHLEPSWSAPSSGTVAWRERVEWTAALGAWVFGSFLAISTKSSDTFSLVFALVSMNRQLLFSAYACAVCEGDMGRSKNPE